MTSKTFNRYVWLLNTLMKTNYLTFEEISDRWERNISVGDGKPLALRTFHMHRDAIYDLFGVEIKCNKSYKYYIDSDSDLGTDKTKQWLFNSFSIMNMISSSVNMKERILYEEIPSGKEYLQSIVEAMKANLVVKIVYEPFGETARELHIETYCLKVYKQRWYIIGRAIERDNIRNLALDRVKSIELTDQHFKMPNDFDGALHFANSVGTYVYNQPPKKVVIRAWGNLAHHLRTLPLHHSQKEIPNQVGSCCDFEYNLCPTPELTTELLSMGSQVEVLEPQELREELRRELEKALGRY